jgi:two-component system chemotaxis response regulator CheY
VDTLPPILIVDDDHNDIFLLTQLLRKVGVRNKIVTFEDALAAWHFLDAVSGKNNSRFMPLLVFTDFHMPRMDGCEFIARVRSNPAMSALPIYMISGYADPTNHQCAIDAGVTGTYDKYPGRETLEKIARECGCSVTPG